MSAMSDRAIQIDEAKELCGYDLVACERGHYRDLCVELVETCKLSRGVFSLDGNGLMVRLLDTAIAKAKNILEEKG